MAEWTPPGPMQVGRGSEWKEHRASVPGTSCSPSATSRDAFPSSRLTWASFSGGAGGGSATCWEERWAAWAQDSGRLDVSGESFLAIQLLPGPGAKPGAGGAFLFLMPLTF